jgi:hypothetical protein
MVVGERLTKNVDNCYKCEIKDIQKKKKTNGVVQPSS